ncbi:PAS domain S-box protein [bacterium]|nr:PAS domain S-box protein [bacterium]NIN91484.1 PAS domain S-box protein [bacterium]NIO17889.1 PAS domain S-box protein [bacterium]NIO72870.1 PAS domain S-box protein [bacterium]
MAQKVSQIGDLERRHRIIVENVDEGLVIYDKNMIATFVNDRLCKILGYSRDQVVGRRVTWFFAGKSKKRVEIELQERRKGKASHYFVRLKTKKGKELLLFIGGVPLFDKNGNFDGGVAVVSDITERKELEDKLEERTRQLEKEVNKRTNLLVDLYRGVAVTEERNRLAEEIHDFCAQALVSSILKIDACEKVLDKSPENLKRELKELRKVLKRSIKMTQNAMLRLRLPGFRRMGFATVLKQYLEEFHRRTGITFNLKLEVDEVLPPTTQLGIYRIFREAMRNVRKHSMAKHVVAKIRTDKNGDVQVMIEDDGKGFDPKRILTHGKYTKNFGLVGMEEQAKLLGGSFAVESARRRGTKIKVKVPLRQ